MTPKRAALQYARAVNPAKPMTPREARVLLEVLPKTYRNMTINGLETADDVALFVAIQKIKTASDAVYFDHREKGLHVNTRA